MVTEMLTKLVTLYTSTAVLRLNFLICYVFLQSSVFVFICNNVRFVGVGVIHGYHWSIVVPVWYCHFNSAGAGCNFKDFIAPRIFDHLCFEIFPALSTEVVWVAVIDVEFLCAFESLFPGYAAIFVG